MHNKRIYATSTLCWRTSVTASMRAFSVKFTDMLSKKKSRPIIVGEINYRWVISPYSDYVVFVAENADTHARKIEVYVDSDINQMWLEFPNTEGSTLRL